ncbi:MAG: ribonuclease Z [Deltaproteobacteria bacterium]|nr:ribonuclease Z [Deltaproteobacteria bacterium]
MRPSLHPRLINGPFDDPGLYIAFIFEKHAILFDVGEIDSLSSRDVLKISHVFVTHTHMDHFSGFDRLLRLFLGRNKTLSLYGPEGFINNVAGKLAGYSWNLVDRYDNSFSLNITEIHPDRLICCRFSCRNRFLPETPRVEKPFTAVLVEAPGWIISAVILDHGIPCLAFSIQEKFHVNIKKDRLEALGLEVGPWIMDFKQALFAGNDPSSIFQVIDAKRPQCHISYELGWLSRKIAAITSGQKITYITDAVFSRANIDKIVNLAEGSDHLFIEAAFLETHRDIAEGKYHLTAWQAGTLATMANVRQFTIFHYSPRYTGQEDLLIEEAIRAYNRS